MLGGEASCHAMIRRRIQRLEVDAGGGYVTVRGGMTLMADATGLKQHNRGEWIRHRWSVRRGFVRAHLLVDGDTKRIVSVSVTDESAGDGPQLKQMLEDAQEHGGLPCKVGMTPCRGMPSGPGSREGTCSRPGSRRWQSRTAARSCLPMPHTPPGKTSPSAAGVASSRSYG